MMNTHSLRSDVCAAADPGLHGGRSQLAVPILDDTLANLGVGRLHLFRELLCLSSSPA